MGDAKLRPASALHRGAPEARMHYNGAARDDGALIWCIRRVGGT